MTSTVRLQDASRALGGFYVPEMRVQVNGGALSGEVVRDVTQLTYRDSLKSIDSFEMTLNNWDASHRAFKYIGSETAATLASEPLYKLFEPCNTEVVVSLGYSGQLHTMLTGTFTTMEPNFPASGAPTLTVRGLNLLHSLRRKQYSHAWRDKKDSEIASNIATLRDRGRRRFPLPIVVSDAAQANEEAIEYVVQDNQYDIDFLYTRARRLGYELAVREAEGSNPRHLYFGPSDNRETAINYELKWGEGLMEFKPTLTTGNQVRSVTVKGWDRRRQREISETVSIDDRRININRDLHELVDLCDPREETVVHEPVFSRREARERATNLLLNRHRQMVKGSGKTVGLPLLRAGSRIQIGNIGSRLSGTWFVESTAHEFSATAGYTTRFEARREDQGEGGTS